jgi:glycosyltransferase involved in cell wall biosynthesis
LNPPHPAMTVVIATRDHRGLLIQAIEGLSRQDGVKAGEFDVIVVADGCTDGTSKALRGLAVPFELTVIEQVHSGLAAARNRGLAEARGEVIVFLDDDVIAKPGLIDDHRRLQSLLRNTVVLGEITAARVSRSPWDAYDDAMRHKRQTALSTTEQPSGIHSAGNLSIHRDLLAAAGGFRGSLPGNQEVELGYRLREMGAEFVFRGAASAEHRGSSDFRSWSDRQSMRGKLDVATYRQTPDGQGLDRLLACFHQRHPLSRALVGALLRRRKLAPTMIWWAGESGALAHRLGLAAISRAAYSVVANTLYWSGVRDALRGNVAFFSLLKAARGAPGLARPRAAIVDTKTAQP